MKVIELKKRKRKERRKKEKGKKKEREKKQGNRSGFYREKVGVSQRGCY